MFWWKFVDTSMYHYDSRVDWQTWDCQSWKFSKLWENHYKKALQSYLMVCWGCLQPKHLNSENGCIPSLISPLFWVFYFFISYDLLSFLLISGDWLISLDSSFYAHNFLAKQSMWVDLCDQGFLFTWSLSPHFIFLLLEWQ